MENFYNHIKTLTSRIYANSTKTYKVTMKSLVYWANWKVDGGEYRNYLNDDDELNEDVIGYVINLTEGFHVFRFRSTAGYYAPADLILNIKSDIEICVVYKTVFTILVDFMENRQIADIF